jgi:hypothetical protein
VTFCEEDTLRRRDFIRKGALAGALPALALGGGKQDVPAHNWDGFDFGPPPAVPDRLNQGPFGIEQDQGWYTIDLTSPSREPVRNWGLGLVGYTWEENGPALSVRQGTSRLENEVERLASLPFVDVLYMRCDWRDVQSRPGRLDLSPVWGLTLDAARRHGLRVAFRVQMSNPEIQPARVALPDFLREKVPLVKIGRIRARQDLEVVEPQYHHPEFQRAFRELTELLADKFDSNPLVEFADLMMYGFWGEGHTSNLPHPFPDALTAQRTSVEMTRYQMQTWKRVPLTVNTQPDISNVGNHQVQDLAVRGGCWLRSDSIVLEEPIQIEALSGRPPWLAVVMEDGTYRHFKTDSEDFTVDAAGVNVIEKAMLHAIDVRANYWALWTEVDNLARYHERYPDGLTTLQRRLGYRVRPSWIWQRKRYDTAELIVAFANDGVAAVPGVLRAYVESRDGKVRVGGGLDAGHPRGGGLRQASFLLPPGMDGQVVSLRGEIEGPGGVRRPLRWASAQPTNGDGSLTLHLKRHDDTGWRKGI